MIIDHVRPTFQMLDQALDRGGRRNRLALPVHKNAAIAGIGAGPECVLISRRNVRPRVIQERTHMQHPIRIDAECPQTIDHLPGISDISRSDEMIDASKRPIRLPQ